MRKRAKNRNKLSEQIFLNQRQDKQRIEVQMHFKIGFHSNWFFFKMRLVDTEWRQMFSISKIKMYVFNFFMSPNLKKKNSNSSNSSKFEKNFK